ncbi:MAG: sigma-70 family RNA polymerase sigma factor [Desulforegulaceae bacterium]|nr:sigma-70 family RNA polymerase sigma factor [Desulforegulaceae bacterium]
MKNQGKKPIVKDEDSELILKIKNGQTDLYETLLSRYETRIYNFGLRMCKDVSDAEDLVQETFINIFRYLKDFRMESKFKNWAYKIAASVCMKIKRKNKSPEKELSMDDILSGHNEKEVSSQIPAWVNQPAEALMNKEISLEIKKEIDNLPPNYRIVLVLRDMEGFSTKEVSEMLDLSESNVKVRLHRARIFVREGLKRYFND